MRTEEVSRYAGGEKLQYSGASRQYLSKQGNGLMLVERSIGDLARWAGGKEVGARVDPMAW